MLYSTFGPSYTKANIFSLGILGGSQLAIDSVGQLNRAPLFTPDMGKQIMLGCCARLMLRALRYQSGEIHRLEIFTTVYIT